MECRSLLPLRSAQSLLQQHSRPRGTRSICWAAAPALDLLGQNLHDNEVPRYLAHHRGRGPALGMLGKRRTSRPAGARGRRLCVSHSLRVHNVRVPKNAVINVSNI